MDTGVFEPVSRSTTRFDDTLLKFYRFKPEIKALGECVNENRDNIAKKKSESKDDIAALQSSNKEKKLSFFGSSNSKQADANGDEDLENNNANKK